MIEETQTADTQLIQLIPYAELEQVESLPTSPFTYKPYDPEPSALFHCLIESQYWRKKMQEAYW